MLKFSATLALSLFVLVMPVNAKNSQLGQYQVAQSQSGFQLWVKSFRQDALLNGISANTLNDAFEGVLLNDRVVQLDRKQAEFSRQIWDYLDTATSPKRVVDGQASFNIQANILNQIEKNIKLMLK